MPHAHLHIEEIGAKSILVAQDGPPATEYTLNPYSGCGMGCAYCYVMKFPHARANPRAWGTWVQPKTNAPYLLGKARAKLWGHRVFLGSATDPYQYIEKQYRLTRRCLKVLAECNLEKLTVHTRSHLILEDIDLLKQFGPRLRVGFSVPTDDDRVRKKLEPMAPKIDLRLKTMRALREAGIFVTAAVAPVLYCNPARFAALLKEVADDVYFGSINYLDRTGMKAMPQAKAYFESADYKALVDELDKSLTAVGLSD
ncbi:MAG: DNA repair photolyase [Candidatus Latescibacterota bacterium]|jgi:DNA repair photolyase